MNRLQHLFRPESVAVIGASDVENKYGHRVLKNIIEGGFGGRIYPVNPSADTSNPTLPNVLYSMVSPFIVYMNQFEIIFMEIYTG